MIWRKERPVCPFTSFPPTMSTPQQMVPITIKLNMAYFQNPKERPECLKITKSWDFSELMWNLMKLCNSCKTCQRKSQWDYQNLERCSLPTTFEATLQGLVITQATTTLIWTWKGCSNVLNASCAFSPWKELHKP